MSEESQRSEELFDTLNKNKQKRRRKVILTVAIALGVIAVILVGLVLTLRRQVETQFAASATEVQSYTVQTGTITTLASGTGILEEVDLEALTVPAGVEINEVLVEAGDTVTQGQLLAKVDMATVMTALSDLQERLDDLDDDIADAKGDTVSSRISAGVSGRVKLLYGEAGMDVAACMAEHGALAPSKSESMVGRHESNYDTVTVYGTTPAYYDIQGLQLSMGRWLKAADVDNSSYVCVINQAAAKDLIGYEDCVGQSLILNGVPYTVVGILEDDDSSLTSILTSGTKVAYIPYTSLIRLSTTQTKDVTTFYLSAAQGSNLDTADSPGGGHRPAGPDL